MRSWLSGASATTNVPVRVHGEGDRVDDAPGLVADVDDLPRASRGARRRRTRSGSGDRRRSTGPTPSARSRRRIAEAAGDVRGNGVDRARATSARARSNSDEASEHAGAERRCGEPVSSGRSPEWPSGRRRSAAGWRLRDRGEYATGVSSAPTRRIGASRCSKSSLGDSRGDLGAEAARQLILVRDDDAVRPRRRARRSPPSRTARSCAGRAPRR